MFLNATRARLLILESAGREMRITFQKKGGTHRVMRCRLPQESDARYVNNATRRKESTDDKILVFCLDCYDRARVLGAGDVAAGGAAWRFVSLGTVEDVVVLF